MIVISEPKAGIANKIDGKIKAIVFIRGFAFGFLVFFLFLLILTFVGLGDLGYYYMIAFFTFNRMSLSPLSGALFLGLVPLSFALFWTWFYYHRFKAGKIELTKISVNDVRNVNNVAIGLLAILFLVFSTYQIVPATTEISTSGPDSTISKMRAMDELHASLQLHFDDDFRGVSPHREDKYKTGLYYYPTVSSITELLSELNRRNPFNETTKMTLKDLDKTTIYKVSIDGQAFVLSAQLENDQNSTAVKMFEWDLDGIILGIDCNDPVYCIAGVRKEDVDSRDIYNMTFLIK